MITITAKIDKSNPDKNIILKAADIIKNGGLTAFPTETVYGLGADALNPEAVTKIYLAKGRPSDNPLILHVENISQAENLVFMNDTARKLAHEFWPGPLTLVLPAKNIVPLKTRGNLSTAAIRMPNNQIALSLIHYAETPIAAPSANLSGRPSPTDFQSVYSDMNGRIDMILDGGRVNVGIESTVIDVTDEKNILLLRPGGMSRKIIEDFLSMKLSLPDNNSKKRSPGTRYKHYSPSIPVKIWQINQKFPECDINSTGYLGINEPPVTLKDIKIFSNYNEYAHELFADFRRLENMNFSCIIVEWPMENSGISEGLRDRIIRASGS